MKGFVYGLVFGFVLMSQPLLARGDVSVLWDATGCPTFPASVLVTARAVGDPTDVRTFTGTVTGPGPFTMALAGLYATQYTVFAITGGMFTSGVQTVMGDGAAPPLPGPTPPTPGQVASVVFTIPAGNPANSLYENQTGQATAKDAAGGVVTAGVTWEAEHPQHVTIDAASGAITKVTMATLDPTRPSVDVGIRAKVNGLIAAATKLIVLRGNAPVPTPTPTPSPPPGPHPPVDLTPSALTQIQAVVTAELQKALTPIIQTPPTCPVSITVVQNPYANGDYRFTVRAPVGCLAAPVVGKQLQVIK